MPQKKHNRTLNNLNINLYNTRFYSPRNDTT